VRTGDWLGLCSSVALKFGPDAREGRKRPIVVEREPDHVLLFRLRIRLGRVFGKAVERHQAPVFRLLSQPRQCGELVFRMFVTGGPPVRGGGGMPQRIRTISRSLVGVADHGAG
jgi:hypothetical protein